MYIQIGIDAYICVCVLFTWPIPKAFALRFLMLPIKKTYPGMMFCSKACLLYGYSSISFQFET